MGKKSINMKLRTLRIMREYSFEDVAKKVGISKSYYWQIENGGKRLYYELAYKIAKVFDLKPDDIFYDYFDKTNT